MAAIELTKQTTGAYNADGDLEYTLNVYVSATTGFTDDPGNALFLMCEGPDGLNYFHRICQCSDIYNYAEDGSDGVTPFYRRGYLSRKFTTVAQAAEFFEHLETYAAYLAADWEALQTSAAVVENQSFTGGVLHVSRKTRTSAGELQEDGTTLVEYRASTLTVTLGLTADYPVFVTDDDELILERVASYNDVNEAEDSSSVDDSSSSGGVVLVSEITICVNSEDRETEILAAMVADLVILAVELEFMVS